MSNFKSGSGDLDFGGSDEDEEETDSETKAATSQTPDDANEASETAAAAQPTSDSPDREPPATEHTSERSVSDANRASPSESTATDAASEQYPYFVRRSNVGDERDTRLEIHVRDKVADQEAEFRSEVAEHLDTNEVSKTDAREFALLAAFQYPERVAELMQDEGFGTL